MTESSESTNFLKNLLGFDWILVYSVRVYRNKSVSEVQGEVISKHDDLMGAVQRLKSVREALQKKSTVTWAIYSTCDRLHEPLFRSNCIHCKFLVENAIDQGRI